MNGLFALDRIANNLRCIRTLSTNEVYICMMSSNVCTVYMILKCFFLFCKSYTCKSGCSLRLKYAIDIAVVSGVSRSKSTWNVVNL